MKKHSSIGSEQAAKMLLNAADKGMRSGLIRRAGVGALLGGGTAYGTSAYRSKDNKSMTKKQRRAKNITAGALGAVAGGLGGALYHNVKGEAALHRAAEKTYNRFNTHVDLANQASAAGDAFAANVNAQQANTLADVYKGITSRARAARVRGARLIEPLAIAGTGAGVVALSKGNDPKAVAAARKKRIARLKKERAMKKTANYTKLGSMERHITGSPQHDMYMKRTAQQVAKKHGLQMNQALVDKMHDIHFLHVAKGHNTPETAENNFQQGIEQELAGTVSSPGGGKFTKRANYISTLEKADAKATKTASIRGFIENIRLNPNSAELNKAFKSYEKKTGKSRNSMSQKDIAAYVKAGRSSTKTAGFSVARYRSLASELDKGTFGETTKEAFAGVMHSISDIVKDDTLTKSASVDNNDYIIDELSSRQNRINTLLKKQVR